MGIITFEMESPSPVRSRASWYMSMISESSEWGSISSTRAVNSVKSRTESPLVSCLPNKYSNSNNNNNNNN